MKTGGIIQARIGATRLPNKVLLSLPYHSHITALEQIIRRTQKASLINEIIVATTDNQDDNAIESLTRNLDIKCFRGDEQNVLSRFFHAAKTHSVDCIVRLTADNPCIDYNLIDSTIGHHLMKGNDYTATKGYPAGLNVEVISFISLEKAFNEAELYSDKEHVTPYISSHPDLFKTDIQEAEKECYHPELRVTLDTEEDYALLCTVYDHLYPENEFFGLREIVDLFGSKPWLKLVNNKIIQKQIFNTLEEEIRETIRLCELQDLKRAREFLKHQFHENSYNN